MKFNIHGIISIIIVFFAVVLGVVSIFLDHPGLAVIFIIVIITGFLSIIYSYCTKCNGRFSCGHFIFGKAAQKLPDREDTGYTITDYAGVILPLLFIIIFPQFWLWGIKWMFFTFWILLIMAIAEITKYVCVKCVNTKCSMCRNKCI